MIVRLSARLGKKIKVVPSVVLPADSNPYADWSAHLFTAARSQYILISNTTSLYSMVMLGEGITDDNKFLKRMMNYMGEFMRHDEHKLIFDKLIDPSASTVSFSKSFNRAVIGSMNDLVFQSKFYLAERIFLFDVSRKLNEAPMSYLDYSNPREAFMKMATNIVPFNPPSKHMH